MKKKQLFYIVVWLFIVTVSFASASGFSQDADQIERAAKSVLKIGGVLDDEPDVLVTGSGFVTFSSSIIVTNYHVIEGVSKLYASDDDDNNYEIKSVLCADKDADIAILEFLKPTKLTPLELYPDNQLKRGSPVVAIGSPEGLKNTVSTGVVSSQFENEAGIPKIQITAPISHGSSGGALFNDDGKVIGVTSSSLVDGQNLNFAINVAVVQAMYNAWDGSRYPLTSYESKAPMDFTGVYVQEGTPAPAPANNTELQNVTASETWTCPNCGNTNSDQFCQECGAEKPNWICACGKTNSGKFCGSCGKRADELVESFNLAMENVDQHHHAEAITILEDLSSFNSGSYSTVKGTHTEAKQYISFVYYEQGIFLISSDGDHAKIIECFTKAGNYNDAKDQIAEENNRYYGAFYDAGLDYLKKGQYAEAIRAFENAGDYSDAKERIYDVHYAEGMDAYEKGNYDKALEYFAKAGDYSDAKDKIFEVHYTEGMDAYEKGSYDKALECFTKAGEYAEAETEITMTYYAMGLKELENGNEDEARAYFEKAGEYSDAKDKIATIDDNRTAKQYEEAEKAYQEEKYAEAEALFIEISGYKDADAKALLAGFERVKAEYEAEKGRVESVFKKYINRVKPFLELDEAKELNKRINYELGLYYLKLRAYASATPCFEEAEDYSDAQSLLLEVKVIQFNNFIKNNKWEDARKYYHEELVPMGYENEYVVMQVGDEGDIPAYILSIVKLMELNWNIPQNEKVYKEAYQESVQKFEEYFELEPDGMLTLDEYIAVKDLIYKGCQSSRVKSLVEKLYDLNYLMSLAQDHTVYGNGYFSGVKTAEKDLGLKVDGIITPDEYETILKQKVTVEKPGNVKARVTNDTVTISWTKVKGAIKYKIYGDSKYLGETTNNSWTEKSVETGRTRTYKVEAIKYTISAFGSTSVYIDPYYKQISAADLNTQKAFYKGKYVKINGLKINSWTIYDGKKYDRSDSTVTKAKANNGYDIYLLCYSGKYYVEIVMENYRGWDWRDNGKDFLSMIKRVTSISITGTMSTTYADWDNVKSIPSITINHLDWNYN